MAGPLSGTRIVEIGGIGPGPFAAMLLADHGAEVIRIERPSPGLTQGMSVLGRSRKTLALDLKLEKDRERLVELVKTADAVIEGFRPGTLERLGLGPETLMSANPRLVVGRITGWGQTGPYAHAAGHDLNYIAVTGALNAIGRADGPPTPPLALAGDFGGGGMMLAFSITAALHHAQRTGQGQVIDCAIMDATCVLMSAFYAQLAEGHWIDQREANVGDGGAPFYDVYETSDGLYISIAAIELQFYGELLHRMGLEKDTAFHDQASASNWPRQKAAFANIFRTKTRSQWSDIFEGTDVCFAPVLSMTEAPEHVQVAAREMFVSVGGILQPAPSPKYSITKLDPPTPSVPFQAT